MHCRSPHPIARYWAKGSAIQFILHVLVTIVLVVIIVASMSTACTTGAPSAYPQCPGTSDNGATCSSSSSCKSGVCRGGNCCMSKIGPGCTDCTTSYYGGNCLTCSSGYTLVIDTGQAHLGGTSGQCVAKTSDGEWCSSSSQCASGVCRGGNCCGSKGRSTGCTDCDSDGDCSTCSSGYTKSSYQCVASKKSDGGSCYSSSHCTSGVCRGGNCCGTDGLSPDCDSCSTNGDCDECSSGYSDPPVCFPTGDLPSDPTGALGVYPASRVRACVSCVCGGMCYVCNLTNRVPLQHGMTNVPPTSPL